MKKPSKNENIAYQKMIAKSVNEVKIEEFKNTMLSLLLDYSLISQTNQKTYDVKIIQSGKYIEMYQYEDSILKQDKDFEKVKKKFIVKGFDEELTEDDIKYLEQKEKLKNNPLFKNKEEIEEEEYKKECEKNKKEKEERKKQKKELKAVELKNINRAKHSMQRLVNANEEKFKTLVTLTFAENLKDVELANKKFNSFRTYLKKIMKKQGKEFYYVGVPEFQKRGAVHYHLLTNIDYEDFDLLEKKEKKIYKPKKGDYQIFRIFKKGWQKGFNSIEPLKNEKAAYYLSKYMTKDIDNRLYGKRKYFYSQNLQKSAVIYLNLNDKKDLNTYMTLNAISENKYDNLYYDSNDKFVSYSKLKIKDLYYDFLKIIEVGE